jgi:MATE family multidrug resistance protein
MGLGMKVEGVAIGTLVAQYAGFLIAAWLYLRNYRQELHKTALQQLWERGAVARFFAVNRDIFLRTLCLVAVTTAFTTIGAKQGNVVLAVNSLLMQLFLLFSYIMDGFAYAGEALGGRFYGAGSSHDLRRLTHRLFLYGLILSLLFTFIYIVGGEGILQLLTDRREVSEAAGAFLPYAIAIPILSFAAFLFDGLFIGCTATRPMLIAMCVATASFFGLNHLLADWGNHALWIAFLSYLLLRGIVQALFWKKNL